MDEAQQLNAAQEAELAGAGAGGHAAAGVGFAGFYCENTMNMVFDDRIGAERHQRLGPMPANAHVQCDS